MGSIVDDATFSFFGFEEACSVPTIIPGLFKQMAGACEADSYDAQTSDFAIDIAEGTRSRWLAPCADWSAQLTVSFPLPISDGLDRLQGHLSGDFVLREFYYFGIQFADRYRMDRLWRIIEQLLREPELDAGNRDALQTILFSGRGRWDELVVIYIEQ